MDEKFSKRALQNFYYGALSLVPKTIQGDERTLALSEKLSYRYCADPGGAINFASPGLHGESNY